MSASRPSPPPSPSALPRRAMLVALDLVRAAVALCLPFVTEVWQVYVLIFLLQAASAGFTPTFQATIPDVLPDEERLHPRPVALPARLRSREPRSARCSRRRSSTRRQLPRPLRRNGLRLPPLGGAGRSRCACRARSRRAARHLRPHHARHPHLPRDPAPARAARAQPRGRRGGRDGDRQHRRLVQAGFGLGRAATSRSRSRPSAAARWSRRSRCRGSSTASRIGRRCWPAQRSSRPAWRSARSSAVLLQAAAALVRDRGRLFADADPDRAGCCAAPRTPRTGRRSSPRSSRSRTPAG